MTLTRLISQGDQLVFESILRKASEMEKELLGASPSALKRLAVESLISIWMQMRHADAMFTANSGNLAQAKFWSQHFDRAYKRFTAAVKQLNAAHQLSPATSGSKQAETAAQTSEECKPGESHDNSSPREKERDGKPATPVGGTDQHCNGHLNGRLNNHKNGKMNGHGKAAAAVANGAAAESDRCLSENNEAGHLDGTNGKSVNRILRFTTASCASTE